LSIKFLSHTAFYNKYSVSILFYQKVAYQGKHFIQIYILNKNIVIYLLAHRSFTKCLWSNYFCTYQHSRGFLLISQHNFHFVICFLNTNLTHVDLWTIISHDVMMLIKIMVISRCTIPQLLMYLLMKCRCVVVVIAAAARYIGN